MSISFFDGAVESGVSLSQGGMAVATPFLAFFLISCSVSPLRTSTYAQHARQNGGYLWNG